METNDDVIKIGNAVISKELLREIEALQGDEYDYLTSRIESLANLSFELADSLFGKGIDDEVVVEGIALLSYIRRFYLLFKMPDDTGGHNIA